MPCTPLLHFHLCSIANIWSLTVPQGSFKMQWSMSSLDMPNCSTPKAFQSAPILLAMMLSQESDISSWAWVSLSFFGWIWWNVVSDFSLLQLLFLESGWSWPSLDGMVWVLSWLLLSLLSAKWSSWHHNYKFTHTFPLINTLQLYVMKILF